jgi:hypothetical protein
MNKANDMLRRAADYMQESEEGDYNNSISMEIYTYLESDEAMELERLRAQVEVLTTAIEAANLALAWTPIASQLHRDAIKLLKEATCQPTP